jgi:hypothetical protein
MRWVPVSIAVDHHSKSAYEYAIAFLYAPQSAQKLFLKHHKNAKN